MTGLAVSGLGVVSAAGIGVPAMRAALAAGAAPQDVSGLYEEALPYPAAHAFTGFDVRATLGRKGTSFLDRVSALALVACGEALADSGLRVDDDTRDRIGIALGTTVGSLRSSSDFSRETLTAERPYLVNPALFPNTVMNCASGQAAIRYGLRGVNSTVATGPLGFLGALRYAANALRRGHADAMLVGAAEELTPHTAWAHRRLGRPGLPGEAAVVVVLEPADRLAGRTALARLAATGAGYRPGGDAVGAGLGACVLGLLKRAEVDPGRVTAVAATEPADPADERIRAAVVEAGLGRTGVRTVQVREALGDCGAATGALQLAVLLFGPPLDPDADAAVLAAWSPEGAFAAAVLEGCGGAGADRQ